MNEWKETDLGTIPNHWLVVNVDYLIEHKIIEKPLDGNHGELHPSGNDFVDKGIPFVMATDVVNGKVDLANCKFITEEQAGKLNKGFSLPGDVLLTHKASIGRTAIVGKITSPYIMLTPQVTYYRVINENKLLNKYLKYFFDSPVFQEILINHSDSGSTRAYIGITAQRELPILLPPLSEQRAIAAVLSSLDDKIDLLHRQNKTLEAMVETLFNEQFIMNNEEWKMGKLGDIATFYNGKSRPKESGEIPVYGGNGILEYTNLSNYGGKSIIIGRVGAYCGSLYFENRDIWVSDNALLVKANNGNHTHFLFYLLKSLELNSMAEGSSHPLLTQTLLKSIDINVPPNEKIESFEFQLEQWTNKMDSNISQIQTLTKLRDTLLPKLMSGEVRVTV